MSERAPVTEKRVTTVSNNYSFSCLQSLLYHLLSEIHTSKITHNIIIELMIQHRQLTCKRHQHLFSTPVVLLWHLCRSERLCNQQSHNPLHLPAGCHCPSPNYNTHCHCLTVVHLHSPQHVCVCVSVYLCVSLFACVFVFLISNHSIFVNQSQHEQQKQHMQHREQIVRTREGGRDS